MFTSFISFQWEVYSHICKALICQSFNSCKRLSPFFINDPLHPCLANALSTSSTWSSFKLLRYRASLYINSLIPSLAFQYFLRNTPFILTFPVNLWLHFHKNKANFLLQRHQHGFSNTLRASITRKRKSIFMHAYFLWALITSDWVEISAHLSLSTLFFALKAG